MRLIYYRAKELPHYHNIVLGECIKVTKCRTIMTLQMAMLAPKSEWIPPEQLPDLSSAKTSQSMLRPRSEIKSSGPGWATGKGEIVAAVAVDGFKCYVPIKHLGGGNLDERMSTTG